MEITVNLIDRMQEIFDEAWGRISSGNRPSCVPVGSEGQMSDGEFWVLYLNFLDCLAIDKEDLLENFDEMVNFGSAVKERVCLRDPCVQGDFILVGSSLVEKALVLGALA